MTDTQLGPICGAPGWNMYVFRDGRQAVSGSTLKSQLADAIGAVPVSADVRNNLLIEALLRAGELECALADAQHPGEQQLTCITEGLAAKLVADPAAPRPESLFAQLPASVPDTVHVSPPEGFAYYALHPHDFATIAARVPLRSHHVVVIGIRTIGVTLGAVVAAELRKHGKHVRRITVRPDGHPYDRRTTFTEDQQRVITQYRNAGADFLVADEGPGMSGSSFLSVADAIVAARVPRDRVTLLCSREPDVRQLRAADGPQRWMQYRSLHVSPNSFIPADAKVYIGAGLWREHLLPRDAEWPESWLHMERLKFLSPDKRTLYKFEGFGRYGRGVHERARKLHELGFGPDCGTPEFGFGIYPLAHGRILQRDDLSRDLLSHMARYCAVRGREFPATDGHAAHSKMEEMARFNFQEEFGDSLPPLDLPDGALASRSPIISDARMQPHEWFCTDDGRVLKLDGAEHGDDHFFPGPTDIAWDLAGAIVEWKLSPEATDTLVREYRRVSGDRVEQRVPAFVAAYASFRMGYCKMAAEAVRGSGEEHRLLRAYERYRDYLAAIASPQRAAVAAAQNANAVDARDADNSRAAEHAPSIFEGPTPEPLAA